MFRHALVALSMAFAVSSGCSAPPPPPGEDWVALQQQDLGGWIGRQGERTVEDGVIHGQALTIRRLSEDGEALRTSTWR